MSGEQTFDTVDTPARDTRYWPCFDDFHYPEVVLKWRDIPTSSYCIRGIFERGLDTFGQKAFLKLENKNGAVQGANL